MKSEGLVPIVIGVSGHRQIRQDDYDAIYGSVLSELSKIKNDYPSSPIRVLTSLACGGDSICALAARELGIPYTAVLPFDVDEFRKDFEGDERVRFEELLSGADDVFVNPTVEEARNADRDYYYRQNSIYMATMVHVFIALWDGSEGRKFGCGTASAVRFALEGSYYPENHIASSNESNSYVIRVATPRNGGDDASAGEVSYLGNIKGVRAALKKTDEFNREARKVTDVKTYPPLGEVYAKADTLSQRAQKSYINTLLTTAVLGTLMIMTFLLYDNLDMVVMLMATILVFAAAFLIIRKSEKIKSHGRYIEYRVLAETMRVRDSLRYAGCETPLSYLMNPTLQTDMLWVMLASDSLDTEGRNTETHDIKDIWVKDQMCYHASAHVKSMKKAEASDRAVAICTYLTAGLYLAALIYEIRIAGRGDLSGETLRKIIKITLGTLSALVFFISGYFGKLSVERQSSDSVKMESFYKKMYRQLELNGQDNEILEYLSREELNEVSNWCSYKIENRPSIDV